VFTKSYVLLANDVFEGNELRHFTFEELTQSLGPRADSASFPTAFSTPTAPMAEPPWS